jgi:hypothetical protein
VKLTTTLFTLGFAATCGGVVFRAPDWVTPAGLVLLTLSLVVLVFTAVTRKLPAAGLNRNVMGYVLYTILPIVCVLTGALIVVIGVRGGSPSASGQPNWILAAMGIALMAVGPIAVLRGIQSEKRWARVMSPGVPPTK